MIAFAGCASPDAGTEPEETRPQPAVEAPQEDLAEIRDLLREYHHETKSSVVRFEQGGPPSAKALLVERRPVDELVALHRMQDPVIYELGGAFWGILAHDLDAAPRFFPILLDDLYRKDSRARAFACEALAYFGEQDARPHLEAALEDRERVLGYTEGTVVADFAARALRFLDAQKGERR